MPSPSFRKFLLAIFGVGVGSVSFWLVARGVDYRQAEAILASSDWKWILIGVALFGLDLSLRTKRWLIIVGHRHDVDYFRLGQGLIVGYAINILLPARLGELFRADYTGRLTNISRPVILGSIFIERLVDLIAVVAIFGAGLAFMDVKNVAVDHVMLLGIIGCIAGVLLTSSILLLKERNAIREIALYLASRWLPRNLSRRILGMISDFSRMVDIVPTTRFILVIAITVPIWCLEAASMWSICRSVGLEPTVISLLTLLGAASLSTLFPTAPGFVGSYQVAFVLVLRMFQVSDTLSLVAATAVQLFIMGIYCLLGLFVWAFAPVRRWSMGANIPEQQRTVSQSS
jgi:glycosyltransferase 2 family protein